MFSRYYTFIKHTLNCNNYLFHSIDNIQQITLDIHFYKIGFVVVLGSRQAKLGHGVQ